MASARSASTAVNGRAADTSGRVNAPIRPPWRSSKVKSATATTTVASTVRCTNAVTPRRSAPLSALPSQVAATAATTNPASAPRPGGSYTRRSAYAAASPRASAAPPARRAAVPTTTPASAPKARSQSAMSTRAPGGTVPPAPQLSAASTSHQTAPASRPAARPTPASARRCILVSRPETPDAVERRPPAVAMRDDRHPDAEQAPEEDLDGRVVERVEVADRDQEPHPGGEDRPQDERQPPVAHRAAAAVDADQRRADHPHHERPAEHAGALHERQVHVGVQLAVRRAVRIAFHLDHADRALPRLGTEEEVDGGRLGGEHRIGERQTPAELGLQIRRRQPQPAHRHHGDHERQAGAA